MIQNLFGNLEEKPLERNEQANQSENKTENLIVSDDESPLEIPGLKNLETNNLPASFETIEPPAQTQVSPEAEIDDKTIEPETAVFHEPQVNNEPETPFNFSDSPEPKITVQVKEREKNEPVLFQMQTEPESTAETARKSGLAWAAAISLFGSVVFCLVIGWFADLLLGTSPWGIVGGIVLGSVVGFVQFFRMTSQIHKK